MDFVQATGIHVIFQFAKCLIDARLIIALNGWCYMQGWIRKETISSRYGANARTELE